MPEKRNGTYKSLFYQGFLLWKKNAAKIKKEKKEI